MSSKIETITPFNQWAEVVLLVKIPFVQQL